MYVCIYIYIHTHTYMYTYTHIYVYTYTYTYTHKHIHTYSRIGSRSKTLLSSMQPEKLHVLLSVANAKVRDPRMDARQRQLCGYRRAINHGLGGVPVQDLL